MNADSIVIYGASDDLIEIEGAIRDEFSELSDDGIYVYVSTGDLIRFDLTDSWRARVVVDATSPVVSDYPDGQDGDQQVAIAGPVAWVVATPTTLAVQA